MTFLLLNLLQPQTRLSWVVIAAAALAFSGGVALLVYFYRRYKRIEKESEEDWDLSRRSIFADTAPRPTVEEVEAPASVEAEAPIAKEAPVQPGGTRKLASDLDLTAFDSALTDEPAPQIETAVPEKPIYEQVASAPRPTEILTSPSVEPPAREQEQDAPFDDEIWAGLEIAEQPPVGTGQNVVLPSTEPLSAARVDQSALRGRFEPPKSESDREPYERPSIVPGSQPEAAPTRELRSPQSPFIEQPGRDRADEPATRGTVRLGSASNDTPGLPAPKRLDSETREHWGQISQAAPVIESEKSVSSGVASRGGSFGSILGLPAEPSHRPLILGEQVRPADETGIGALTHYGQDLGPKGGRAGTVALVIVLSLLAAAAGTYLFVPSVHARVDSFVARLRGTQTQESDAKKPKAQIIPSSRPEVNKNLVTARGAVDNISDAPLERLEVEVSLQRGGDAPPETRRIPVTPDLLPPGERGTFEFEYDGKRDTGFAGYTITRLFSSGTEVRFRTPAQK